ALKNWALPVVGVNATPRFYSEAEYYAAKVDELRTYPVYVKNREPKGYRESIRRRGPQPLVAIGRARTEAEWNAAGLMVFHGMDLPENRMGDPKVLEWLDDPDAPVREHALITGDGIIVGFRWVVDRDRKLKVTIPECSSCHTRVLPDGTTINGAQGNFKFGLSVDDVMFARADEALQRLRPLPGPAERRYQQFGVPWLTDDIHARFKTMSKEELDRIDGTPTAPSTFSRFNGSPYFTNHMPDLIGVRDRKYLDA